MTSLLNAATLTQLTINPASRALGGAAARQSLSHVLVVPRTRRYNAVSLTESDTGLVRHLQQVGRAAARALLRADSQGANFRIPDRIPSGFSAANDPSRPSSPPLVARG